MTVYTTTIAKTETVPVPFEQMPKHVQEKIIAYGCQRIFNDMVGGSERFPTVEQKVAHVKEKIAEFLAGNLGGGRGPGVSAEQTVARQLVRAALKAKYGAKSATWAKFTGLSDSEQAAKLDEVFDKNRAAFEPEVKAELARREAAAKKRAKAAEGLALDL